MKNKKALLISAIASNQGKTVLTMALLHHYKKSVCPFKCGPDFIDPQFHERIAKTPSVNLDGYMMNQEQLQWIFSRYFDKEVAVIEGVMGYYDGMDKGASAYDVAKSLHVNTLLLLDGGGSYITVAAVLQGMLSFRNDNTIKAIILNNISSVMHYELVKKHIEAECAGIVVCGWIQKGLETLEATHLGLDLKELDSSAIEEVSKEVLEHIEIEKLESVMQTVLEDVSDYPFKKIVQKDEKCVLVKDENFSFIYHDNIKFLQEIYKEVELISSTKDEKIPSDADVVILPGGYVETDAHYKNIKNSLAFKNSLQEHAKTKKIYAECAGLIYLGKVCDEKKMSEILPITFTLTNKRERLGYYKCELGDEPVKGHAFHYTKITQAPKTDIKLYKISKKSAKEGGYRQDNIFATYLHTMWRVNFPPYM
ncbi:cobyrinate a,c-diamide synthase [Sulfurimonas sediminis]|uniref:Cobyrinate a,c-diamide synthase n=1 Tax=Sulfurimonas sediminis TaxID=2590020 RepID=A0A7M1B1L6_9BACT|nr:cobyrinate a,c-diamide synthase [Sulfurimonas sediminis]QOP42552.1 cobyrinate a,c-diamide synthase [Sulfurimonas sediminis]